MTESTALPVAESAPVESGSVLADQPIKYVLRDGIEYVLLGTAHVSRASVAAVRELLETQQFDAVAVELCESRYNSIRNPDALRQLDLFQVIRDGKAGLVAANLALSSFQRRLAEQFGIEPGAEMKAAIDVADAQNLPIWLIDREVGTTLKRAYRSVGFMDRLGIVGGLVGSLFSTDEVNEAEIEKLKQGDMLTSMFDEFAKQSEPLYRSLIAERDSFMAARLREESAGKISAENIQSGKSMRVLAVLGAGHLAGIERELVSQQEAPAITLAPLKANPPAARWPKVLGLGMLVLIIAAIAYAFTRGASFGTQALQDWVVFTAGGSAIGALIAGAHPLSILAAALAGPLKPFRPLVPSGAFSAGTELWLRRPQVGDFDALRHDLVEWRGWWRNRVARTLMIFMFTNLGMMLGEYLAAFRIVKRLI